MLQVPNNLCSPLLDSLQWFPVFPELGSPELGIMLQIWPYQSCVEGVENLLQPAGHALFSALQEYNSSVFLKILL